jgi:hypothetical protein
MQTIKFCLDNESLFYFSKCGDLNVLGVAIVESEGNAILDKDTILKALYFMRKRHPLSRAKIEHNLESKEIHFLLRNLDQTELDLEWSKLDSRENLIHELESFHSKLFDFESSNLIWGAKCIEFVENSAKKYALCLNLPIFLTDGFNISAFLAEIVNVVNALLSNTECEEMTQDLDYVEDFMVLCESRNLFTDKQRNALDNASKLENNKFLLDEKLKGNENGLKINILRIEKSISEQIINQCKNRKEKLTGFFTAIFVYALKDLYSEQKISFPDKIKIGISVNLRIRYQPNLELNQMGNHSTYAYISLDSNKFDQFNVWSDTKYINDKISEAINIDDASLFVETHNKQESQSYNEKFRNSFQNNSNNIEKVCSDMSEDKSCDLFISNAARYIIDHVKFTNSPFSIKELYFGDSLSSLPPITSSLAFHCSYFNDEQQIMLSSNKSSILSIHTDRLMNLFENIIQNCLF